MLPSGIYLNNLFLGWSERKIVYHGWGNRGGGGEARGWKMIGNHVNWTEMIAGVQYLVLANISSILQSVRSVSLPACYISLQQKALTHPLMALSLRCVCVYYSRKWFMSYSVWATKAVMSYAPVTMCPLYRGMYVWVSTATSSPGTFISPFISNIHISLSLKMRTQDSLSPYFPCPQLTSGP